MLGHTPNVIWRILLASVVMLAFAAAPAYACGIYIPREGEARMAQERALIRWDGKTEDLVMEMSVEGRSTEAAWIVPVPARATVKLADARLFEELQELTKPRVEVQVGEPYATAASAAGSEAGGAAVTVLGRQALGPFEVSTLAAQDAQALETWLRDNGYRLPDRLTPLLDAYVAKQWYYVAVRLVPEKVEAGLTGQLDPLWLSFASNEIVYPMRLFTLAPAGLPVFLYVLADHRAADPRWADTASNSTVPIPVRMSFAGWVEPRFLAQGSAVAPFVERKRFLTKFDIFFDNPAAITSDFVFPRAASDETYRDVEVQYVMPDDPRAAQATNRREAVSADETARPADGVVEGAATRGVDDAEAAGVTNSPNLPRSAGGVRMLSGIALVALFVVIVIGFRVVVGRRPD